MDAEKILSSYTSGLENWVKQSPGLAMGIGSSLGGVLGSPAIEAAQKTAPKIKNWFAKHLNELVFIVLGVALILGGIFMLKDAPSVVVKTLKG